MSPREIYTLWNISKNILLVTLVWACHLPLARCVDLSDGRFAHLRNWGRSRMLRQIGGAFVGLRRYSRRSRSPIRFHWRLYRQGTRRPACLRNANRSSVISKCPNEGG